MYIYSDNVFLNNVYNYYLIKFKNKMILNTLIIIIPNTKYSDFLTILSFSNRKVIVNSAC